MKQMKQILATLTAVLMISGVALAIPGAKTETLPEAYYIHSTDPIVKGMFTVKHEFPSAVSAELTPLQVGMLGRMGIETEKVSVYRIAKPYCNNNGVCEPELGENPSCSDCKNGGSSVTRSCYPDDQTPWGIERVYNDPGVSATSGGSGVTVAVLDTGVYQDHPDLKANIADCVTMVTHFRADSRSCEDRHGHGTHVSGTVLANGGSDGKGIYGVAPEASLMAVKVCDRRGYCYEDDIAAGIYYAADNGANIISMSLGGSSIGSQEKAAIDYAVEMGVLVIAAAGNSGPDLDTIEYPGAYYRVVAVAATDSTDRVADFSSRGVNDRDYYIEEREVEVATPGVSVESTYNDGCYAYMSGTSMATPHASGLSAKFWASGAADSNSDGITTAGEVRAYLQIRANATDIIKGYYADYGDDPASGFGLPTVG